MKTKIIFIAITTMAAMTMFTSCEKIKGKGEVITEQRTTGTYNSISLAMSATVYFTQGAEYSLKVSGQENVLNEIVTQVEGNRLVIRVRKGVNLGSHEPIRVNISAPGVSAIDVSGSGDIFADGEWNANEISINISGSGNINLASVNAGHVSANISGSGTINAVTGKVVREDLNISGSGTIDLRSVEAETVYTTTSGSGNTFLHATQFLDVTVSGSGNTWYYGTPLINTHISGSGSLRKM
jgi:hypothetical protein